QVSTVAPASMPSEPAKQVPVHPRAEPAELLLPQAPPPGAARAWAEAAEVRHQLTDGSQLQRVRTPFQRQLLIRRPAPRQSVRAHWRNLRASAALQRRFRQ